MMTGLSLPCSVDRRAVARQCCSGKPSATQRNGSSEIILSVNPPLARRVNYDDLPSERSSSDVAFSSAAARSNSPACSNKRAVLSEPDDSDDSEQSSMTARSHASKVDLLIIVFHWADQDRTEFDVSYIPVVHSVHPV